MPKPTYIQLAWCGLCVCSGSLACITLLLAFGAGPNHLDECVLCFASNAIAGILFLIVFVISLHQAFPARTKS